MLVNITQDFFVENRRWKVGDNPDVPKEVALRWIAEGKATADTDGRRNDGSAVPGDGIYAYTRGFTASRLPKTTAGLAAVRAGVGNLVVDFIGDSTTGDSGGVRTRSWSHAFAQSLAARDGTIKSSTDAWAGQMNMTTIAALRAIDPRWGVIPAGWSINAQFSYGGNILQCANTTTDAAPFNPQQAWNTVEIEWLALPNQGTITLAAGATVFATIDATANPYLSQKATFSTGSAAAIQTLNIARSAGGQINALSIRCWDSATRAVLVCNAGTHSSVSTSWATNGGLSFYGVLARMTKRAPDLLVIALGVNDWNTAVSLSAHIANLTTIAQTQQAAGGDVVFIGQPESDSATFAAAEKQDEYRAAQFELADSLGCAALNIKAKMGGFAQANALGYMSDQRHVSFAGGACWGDALAQAVAGL